MQDNFYEGVYCSMSVWEIAGICAGIFIILVIIQKISGSQTPVRSVILSMLVGILALTAVNLCSGFTNVSVPVSLFSLAVSSVLGIPGLTMLLILQMIL